MLSHTSCLSSTPSSPMMTPPACCAVRTSRTAALALLPGYSFTCHTFQPTCLVTLRRLRDLCALYHLRVTQLAVPPSKQELSCTPKKEYRRRRQRVRCLLTAYAVEGFLCGQTAKEDLPPLAAAKLAGRRGVRGTPAAWRTSDALYSTSSTISSSASIFSSSISFSFSSRALKSITKSL